MKIGDYELRETLGEGAAARVYAAIGADGREVAIKRLRSPASVDAAAATRLAREGAVLRELDHPGLVRVLGTGEDHEGHGYLVLERVRGPSLRELLDRDGPLPPERAWAIVRDVALALKAAHAAGILHRDLTPANVLLDGARPKLGDFGLAQRQGDPRISRDGASTGTPAYMAPEQFWGADVDERTDVYGLGAILYACLTGRPPWDGDVAEILHRMATAEPPPLPDAMPAEVRRFVRSALARRPVDRPPDVDSFVRAGDAAFGRSEGVDPIPFVLGALALVLPVAIGFAGSHAPTDWIHEAGPGGWAIVGLAVIGAVFARGARSWRPLIAAAPLLAGALVFSTGLHVVLGGLARAAPERRFEIFHLGWAEASAGWYIGAALSSALLAFGAARGSERVVRPELRSWIACGAILVAAMLAAEAGAIAIGVFTLAIVLLGVPRRGPDAAISSLAATVALALAVWVRLQGEAARLWISEDVLRADRVARIVQHASEEKAAIAVAATACVAIAWTAKWQGIRTWPRSRVLVGGLTATVLLLALFGPWLWGRAERRRLFEELAPRFSVWAELDPPRGEGDGPARIGPTLQLGRRRIALDGVPIAPLASLRSAGPTGPLLIAERLGPRVEPGRRSPELVLAADRSLRWRVVARALGAARDLGVRRVDVVQLPGAPFAPRVSAEAAIVLPRDLRAFPIELASSRHGALVLEPELRFDEAVRRMRARRGTPIALD